MSDTEQVKKPKKLQVVWEYAPDARAADAVFQAFTLLLKDDIGYPQEAFDERGEPVH